MMNYVLSERSVAWMKRQMARTQGYLPAPAAPSRLVRRDTSIPASKPIQPLTVRFVPSVGQGAEVGDGDFIIYVPDGSVVVNGVSITAEDVPLQRYETGEYADRPAWYALPQMSDGDSVVLGVSFDPEDYASPLLIDIYTGDPVERNYEDEAVSREFIVADVSITQPVDGVSGRVSVHQVLEGPLVLEVGVETLNGAMGRLSVVAGQDGIVFEDGKKYWINVDREEGAKEIVVSLSDVPPSDDPEDGGDEDDEYCNDISDDGADNDISDDGGFMDGGGGSVQGGNDISSWPCNQGEEEE